MTKTYLGYFLIICAAFTLACNNGTTNINSDDKSLQDTGYVALNLVSNENAFHEVYAEKGIRACHITKSEFENGEIISEFIESIKYYDSLGYLTLSKEFIFEDSIPVCIKKYTYDEEHRLIAESLNWRNSRSFERSEYIYTDRLIGLKDFQKDSIDLEYQLESKTSVSYKQNKIDVLSSENEDTICYFIHKGARSYQYADEKNLLVEYENGFVIKFLESKASTNFERDEKGNILEINSFDEYGEQRYSIVHEYDKGLLVKTTGRFGTDEIKSLFTYNYSQ